MRHSSKSVLFAAALALAAAPAFAGIHYKSVTHMEGGPQGRTAGDTKVEGWAAGDKSRVEFRESASPLMKPGMYMITKDGGKTMYMVNPEDKTYFEWDLKGMLGTAGAVMNGMGAMVKMDFSTPKVEKLVDEDGGTLLGLPTRHVRYRTSYTLTVKVLGMGNSSDVVSDQDIWTTQKLSDLALGAWLRADPPHTGNEQLDKLIASGREKIQGIPLKMITVSTNTDKKKGKQTVTRMTMEVTEINTSASVPPSSFEIPAGYKESEMMMPARQGRQ
ncbi:MAG TPA: DUF4412 domain-containing protein [Thermoanaerobaculia bacterium]|jgi:hypothetical protein|nr:DUF4412 domain-containing protein [Thermoanaerobaculia bacterium]